MAKKPIVVDFHAHILEPYVLKMTAGRTVTTGFGAQAEPPRAPGSRREQWYKQMMDPEAHIEGMSKMGVDVVGDLVIHRHPVDRLGRSANPGWSSTGASTT